MISPGWVVRVSPRLLLRALRNRKKLRRLYLRVINTAAGPPGPA